ncbi:hypothetical protein GS486_10105 [Rhodococcus hoagii]|nr:hypothetical protein [Prescottella equi]
MTEPARLSVSPARPRIDESAPLAGLTRQQRLEYLRRRMAAVPARGEAADGREGAGGERVLPVPGRWPRSCREVVSRADRWSLSPARPRCCWDCWPR